MKPPRKTHPASSNTLTTAPWRRRDVMKLAAGCALGAAVPCAVPWRASALSIAYDRSARPDAAE